MIKVSILLFVFVLFQSTSLFAQKPSEFLPEKPGKWSYSSNIKSPGADVVVLNKNLAALAEWFHLNVPMLLNPKGYDLDAWAYGSWDDHYKMSKGNYALRAEMDFNFQLFLSNGGKWTVEPPAYSFEVNDTEGGHHSRGNFPYFDELKDDPALEKAINAAAVKMNGIFATFEFVKQIISGVDVFRESADGDRCHIMVYNHKRPPYWLPVTVKEVADIYLEYYSLHTKLEIDKMLFEQLKSEIAELTAEELAAPACQGHDSHFVLPVNGTNQGLKLMRFNPDYWDRSLPNSEIQLMSFWFPQMDDAKMEEYYKNNRYPLYAQLLVNEIDWGKLVGMIQK
jgi:hypothetical protein